VIEVSFKPESSEALIKKSTKQLDELSLTAPSRLAGDGTTLMVALEDLAKIYGPEFRSYKIYAYDSDPGALASIVTTLYNGVSVNIKMGSTFLRVDCDLQTGDSQTRTTKAVTGESSAYPKVLSVAPYGKENSIFVPVVEFMKLFGKPVTVY